MANVCNSAIVYSSDWQGLVTSLEGQAVDRFPQSVMLEFGSVLVASGAPSVQLFTATGVAYWAHAIHGSPSIQPFTAVGFAQLTLAVEGSPAIPPFEVTGDVEINHIFIEGSPSFSFSAIGAASWKFCVRYTPKSPRSASFSCLNARATSYARKYPAGVEVTDEEPLEVCEDA